MRVHVAINLKMEGRRMVKARSFPKNKKSVERKRPPTKINMEGVKKISELTRRIIA